MSLRSRRGVTKTWCGNPLSAMPAKTRCRVFHSALVVLCSLVAAVLSGCGGGGYADPNAIARTFDIGGRSLYLSCSGSGRPTVVMDAGLGNTHETWHAVAPTISKRTRTCTYDRANLGASDAAPKPRTSAEVVSDLQRLLSVAKIRPPYVLVGHSFGGLDVRLFASDHPKEVSALVLVDPTPTAFLRGECALVSASLCADLRHGWDPSNNPDGLDFVKSANELDHARALPDIPVIVLAATNHQQAAITDPGIEKRIEALWQREQRQLAASVPHGKLILVPSGHDIQELHPDAVTAAITSLLH